jgi:hypothetical protein
MSMSMHRLPGRSLTSVVDPFVAAMGTRLGLYANPALLLLTGNQIILSTLELRRRGSSYVTASRFRTR